MNRIRVLLMLLGVGVPVIAQYNNVQQQIRQQQWQIQNQQRQIQNQARRMQQQAGLQNRNYYQSQNVQNYNNVAVQFTRLELKHNVPDNSGRKMLQCWFSFSAQGVYQHQLQPVLSIEIPQGTSHVLADGSPMVYEGTTYNCVYPGINTINNAWLGYYNDALNPLPGTKTYYVCIYIKDVTTGQYIAKSNYLSFDNTGEEKQIQQQYVANNVEDKPKGRTNLYQDNIAAAYRGDAEAQALVGIAYMLGDGIDINYKEAFNWFKKSADQGFPKGQHNVGICYENGKGVDVDLQKAVYWYQKASDQGFANAQSDLAVCYINGRGVEKNSEKAVYWARKAAEQGLDVAQLILGHCYFEGQGVKKDQNAAVTWFQKAAEQGNVGAQAYLGFCYYSGQGTKQDQKKGEKLLSQAAEQGNEEAIKFLAQIEEQRKQEALAANKTPPVDVDINIPESASPDHDIFAVIIGNEKYRNVDGVPFAENDAKVFKEYVEKTLGVPERQIMYVENAGYNDLRQAVNWLAQAMTVCRGQGKAIFYYAGHGIPNEKDQSAYLLPVDGVGNDIGSAYSLKTLYETFGKMDAKSVTVFLDACFSGSKRENGMLVSARGVAIKAKPNAPLGNMVVFSAAQGDETAYPYKEKSHGLFTYFLLKKLQETKGNCSLGDLGSYVTSQVSRNSITINKKSQTPSVIPSPVLTDRWQSMGLR